jgi:hypothetical protein
MYVTDISFKLRSDWASRKEGIQFERYEWELLFPQFKFKAPISNVIETCRIVLKMKHRLDGQTHRHDFSIVFSVYALFAKSA